MQFWKVWIQYFSLFWAQILKEKHFLTHIKQNTIHQWNFHGKTLKSLALKKRLEFECREIVFLSACWPHELADLRASEQSSLRHAQQVSYISHQESPSPQRCCVHQARFAWSTSLLWRPHWTRNTQDELQRLLLSQKHRKNKETSRRNSEVKQHCLPDHLPVLWPGRAQLTWASPSLCCTNWWQMPLPLLSSRFLWMPEITSGHYII